MTISDGSTIIATDLNALITTDLGRLQDDNARVPLGYHRTFTFKNLVASTNALYRRARVIVPFDCYLETLAVRAAEFTAASTLTVTVEGDGALVNWPIEVSGAVGTGTTNVTRLLYDNTKRKVRKSGGGFATVSTAFRVFPKGSTIVITPSTTSVATPSMCSISMALRQFFARE